MELVAGRLRRTDGLHLLWPSGDPQPHQSGAPPCVWCLVPRPEHRSYAPPGGGDAAYPSGRGCVVPPSFSLNMDRHLALPSTTPFDTGVDQGSPHACPFPVTLLQVPGGDVEGDETGLATYLN